ncbi:class I SAM-dependent methyltransferase [Amycolatopsis sp. OK19-0408]|uniref:Class I SAM-dependent methyltransferase n=1 Tax=Amycolatopsis iheyensis TaxID=2945988 RepID=A0A9X2SNA3_9PSEU|nr:class I SAM-dependent methyltransferase [Amycolatopsis iheyensis]MCR6488767.1 class I SAM-dependent methyltransferase [Amycolatopsis iheyensis]
MDGFELYDLGSKLMRLGEDAIPDPNGLRQLSQGVQHVMLDIFGHAGTSTTDIAERTGFPESYVETSVAALRDRGALTTETDPDSPGRTIVKPVAQHNAAARAAARVDERLGAAAAIDEPGRLKEVVGILEMLARRMPKAFSPEHFDAQYAGTPPWETGGPQPALRSLAEAGAFRGRVLEAGCGTGEHALMTAALGLPTVGIDPASAAIETARRKARERGLDVRFLVADALDLGALGEQFDTVLDCGLFHVFTDAERVRYVDSLATVMPPGARLFLVCFSDRQPPGNGPRRVSQDELRACFATGWRIDAIEPAKLDNNNNPDGAHAWRARITRV